MSVPRYPDTADHINMAQYPVLLPEYYTPIPEYYKEFNIKPKETLLITDSVGDVKEAHEVKMKAIGVLWGLHERERLERNGVDFVAETPKDILTGIKKILTLN